jgi:ribonucleoside-diphosphate reductase alpha chain
MVKYKKVKAVSTEDYFYGNQFSIDAFNNKYRIHAEETYVDAIRRVCKEIASVESTDDLRNFWAERWFDEIYNDWWHPAGSIMQGAGSKKKISLANCTTISLGARDDVNEWDNLESILRNGAYTVAKTAAYRQGLGVDFSRLRPKGSAVHNSSNSSAGVTHWMNLIDSLGYYVGQEGRRPAMLFSLNATHPDIIDFLTVKDDFTQIQNANISIQLDDKFYHAVELDEDWEMRFTIPAVKQGQKVYVDKNSATADMKCDDIGFYYLATKSTKKEVIIELIRARDLLEKISKAMLKNAEPGIQNIDIAKDYSNSDALYNEDDKFDPRIISTNACSEQYLPRDGLCILSSFNAGKLKNDGIDPTEQINTIAYSMVRFLDNVVTYELLHKSYATDLQRQNLENLRRIGAGITNLAGYLFELGHEYGSELGNVNAGHLMRFFNSALYDASIKLGEEKGNFKLFDQEKLKKSKFIKHMLNEGKEFTSLRNICLSSIAPTGTLSLMFREMVLGYGIEPSFGPYYWKRTRITGEYKYYFVVPNAIRVWMEAHNYNLPMDSDTIEDTWDGENGKILARHIDVAFATEKIHLKRDTDVNMFDKLGLMKEVMKNVDSSISVTYNLPKAAEWKDVYKFIIDAHKADVKSVSVFPDQKIYGIVSSIPFKELAFSLKEDGTILHPQNFNEKESNALNISEKAIRITSAPKRPTILPADIYAVVVKGERFVIAVGLLNGAPYEIFGGKMNGLSFKFNQREGIIEKIKKKQYKIEFDDISIDDFSKQFSPVEEGIFRMASLNLRHGVEIHYVVDQLQKSASDILSFNAAAARVLKKYIKDGQVITGTACSSCKAVGTLVYIDGCATCSVCEWSKC